MFIREIMSLIRDGNPVYALIIVFSEAFVVFCCLPVHECAHAWAAHRLGDDTARLQGRLTLSPLKHLDLFGVLLMFFIGVGYAKPVPVNIRNFKNQKVGFALTSLAGPVSNLVMALLFYLIRNGFDLFNSYACSIMAAFFDYVAYVNVALAIFNLLPVPPLDGSRLLGLVIPDKYYYRILQYERYIRYALIILVFAGAFTTVLTTVTGAVSSAFEWVSLLPFRLFGLLK